jgi:hypothetical protein
MELRLGGKTVRAWNLVAEKTRIPAVKASCGPGEGWIFWKPWGLGFASSVWYICNIRLESVSPHYFAELLESA